MKIYSLPSSMGLYGLIISLSISLSSCGQKGDLVRPSLAKEPISLEKPENK